MSLNTSKENCRKVQLKFGSGAHAASCTMRTGGPFPGGKAQPGRDADHSPHLVPTLRMSRSKTSSPPPPQAPAWRVAGSLYFFFLQLKLLMIRWGAHDL
jgi:hypothetical protein